MHLVKKIVSAENKMNRQGEAEREKCRMNEDGE